MREGTIGHYKQSYTQFYRYFKPTMPVAELTEARFKEYVVYLLLYFYNKNRGVATTGIHRYRHTFAKQWILNGGNVVTLSRLLGHSSLAITQNYINLLVSDLAEEVENIDLVNKFGERKSIKLK